MRPRARKDLRIVLLTAWLASAAVLGVLAGRRLVLGGGPGRSAWSFVERAPPDLSPHDAAVVSAAREFGVDADLVRGLVAAESGGDASAVSGKDAVGLMQLTLATAAEQARALGQPPPTREDLRDPATNVRLGTRYLSRLLADFGGAEAFALAAYNAGATPVRRWRSRAPDASALDAVLREGYAETRNLVTRSLRFRDAYRAGR
jgi:soluble lytic murein transglycosylase